MNTEQAMIGKRQFVKNFRREIKKRFSAAQNAYWKKFEKIFVLSPILVKKIWPASQKNRRLIFVASLRSATEPPLIMENRLTILPFWLKWLFFAPADFPFRMRLLKWPVFRLKIGMAGR